MCAAKILGHVTLLLSLAGPCLAGETITEMETDRPDQTETAAVVPPGSIQFEGGTGITHDAAADEARLLWSTTSVSYPSMLFRCGLVEWGELRIGFDYSVITRRLEYRVAAPPPSDASALDGTISIGAKIALLGDHAGEGTRMAVIADIATSQTEPARWSPGLTMTVDRALAENVKLGCNVGGAWDRGEKRIGWRYTSSLGVDLSDRIGGYLEVFGELARGLEPEHSCDLGITLAATPDLQFDLEGGLGLTPAAPDYFIAGGVSFRLFP